MAFLPLAWNADARRTPLSAPRLTRTPAEGLIWPVIDRTSERNVLGRIDGELRKRLISTRPARDGTREIFREPAPQSLCYSGIPFSEHEMVNTVE